jgi:hypothetical protein
LEYAPDVATALSKTPITLDRISPRGSGEANRLVYFMGFPSKAISQSIKTPAVGPRLIDLDFKLMFYANAPTLEDAWPELAPPDEPVAKLTDIFLKYDQEDEIWKTSGVGGKSGLTEPGGTSGGGWWQGINCEGKIWQAESVQLIGIQSKWSKKKKYIRACQIHHWLRLVYDNEPDLQNSLRTAFGELFDEGDL